MLKGLTQNSPYRFFQQAAVLALLCVIGSLSMAQTDNPASETVPAPVVAKNGPVKVEVIDPYAEVRSGPGRGYPIFYAIEQGETIELLKRRPGWYEVRSMNGQIGWTTARQISRTIQATGEPADLPSVGYGDFIKNSWYTGFFSGQFATGELEGFELFTISGGYRFLSWLGVGVDLGRTFGSDSSGDLYGLNASIEPFSRWKLSPLLSLGRGKFSLDSQPKQVTFTTDTTDYYFYGLGASYYLGRNFVIKGDVLQYVITVDDNEENLGTWRIGFLSFF